MSSKVCTYCKIEKDVSEYAKDSRTKLGVTSRCLRCHYKIAKEKYHNDEEYRKKTNQSNRNNTLLKRYGIDVSQFEAMIEEQGNSCLVCKIQFDKSSSSQKPNIDHCHRTGKVRGILCTLCNAGLGSFRDSQMFLYSAITYLKDSE